MDARTNGARENPAPGPQGAASAVHWLLLRMVRATRNTIFHPSFRNMSHTWTTKPKGKEREYTVTNHCAGCREEAGVSDGADGPILAPTPSRRQARPYLCAEEGHIDPLLLKVPVQAGELGSEEAPQLAKRVGRDIRTVSLSRGQTTPSHTLCTSDVGRVGAPGGGGSICSPGAWKRTPACCAAAPARCGTAWRTQSAYECEGVSPRSQGQRTRGPLARTSSGTKLRKRAVKKFMP